MPPNDDKIRVSARISKDLYDSVLKIDDNFTRALVAALTTFVEPKEKDRQTDYDNNKTNDDKVQFDIIKAQLDIMTAQVEYLKGQIVVKDQQLDKQAFSLQSVIQENSRLNIKLLPESQEAKKTWWKFW
jgi:exosome complex RNA-binding protein Rrp42 (RNase PH superfamily)